MLPVERTYTVVLGPETDGGFSVRVPRGAYARAIRLKNASSAHARSSSSTLKSRRSVENRSRHRTSHQPSASRSRLCLSVVDESGIPVRPDATT